MKAADTPPSPSPSAPAAASADDPNRIIYPAGLERPATDPAAPAPALLPGAGWVFILLVAAGAAGFWAWRRYRPGHAAARRTIQIEDTRALGNRQFLVVASCDGRRFLLGVAPGGIRLLSPLESDLPDDADDARPLP